MELNVDVITAVNDPSVHLERVDVEFTAQEDEWSPAYWTVWPIWSGVDRPEGAGIGCSNAKVAQRLVTAIKAGAVLGPAEVCIDANGKTYVNASSNVLARRLNADLRRLGF